VCRGRRSKWDHRSRKISRRPATGISGVIQIRGRENKTMAEKKNVKAAPKKEAQKSLKGIKKLGETKLMSRNPLR